MMRVLNHKGPAIMRVPQVVRLLQTASDRRLLVAPLCLVGCLGFFAASAPSFLGAGNLVNVLAQIWVLALLAAGQTFPMVTRGFDLSVGTVAALASTAAALAANRFGLAGLALGPLAGLACGTLSGILVGPLGLQPIIATLGVMTGARGLATLVSGGQAVPLAFGDLARDLSLSPTFGLPPVCWVALGLVAAAAWILGHSVMGRRMLMLGSNPDAVPLVGIRPASVQLRAYQMSGLFAGFAGTLITLRAGTGLPAEGSGLELQSIAAAMIGGTALSGGAGSIPLVIVGAAFIQVLLTGLNLQGVSPFLSQTAIGLVIIASGLMEFTIGRLFVPSFSSRRSL